MSEYDFVSISAVNGISFSSAFSFTAENEKCFPVGLWYTSQKGLGLGLEIKVLVLIFVLKKGLDYITAIKYLQMENRTVSVIPTSRLWGTHFIASAPVRRKL